MAGYNTVAQLLEDIGVYGTGQLGNYKVGISIASPDDIKTIAEATGSISPKNMQRLMMMFYELPEIDQKRLVKLAEVIIEDKQ